MSIGKTLREKREERKLSIAQISSVIRINKKYLQALEDENFLLIPSLVYAKGFLKAYSEYLGVDPKGLITELTDYFKTREEGRKNVISAPKAPKNFPGLKMPDWNVELKMPRFPKIDLSFKMPDLSKINLDIRAPKLPQMPKLPDMPKPLAMPKLNFNIVRNAARVAGVLIILFIVVLVSKQASSHFKRMMLIKANPPAAAKVESQVLPKKNPVDEMSVPSGRIEVKVQAVKKARVNVSSGSKELFAGTIQPGTKLRFVGREVKVVTDNGGAIKMIVGGDLLGLMGEDGVAAERTYKASE
jgi:transcriptional regulator with XRE-family HTH domain